MPIISAHTQTRLEGYFRLEWKLAEDRSHLMAKGKAFIVPVTVDGTGDIGAQVPDAFLAVQWTRLPGGETPPAFGERVKQLMAGPQRETEHQVTVTAGHSSSRSPKASRIWIIPAVVGAIACVALAILKPWHKGEKPPQAVQVGPSASEAQQLVAKAWEQLDKTEMGPEELEIADGFCRRAADLEPANAEVWAAWAQVDSWFIYHNFDASKERQEAARSCAARALELAPGSYEARLAQACYLVRGATVGTGLGEVSSFSEEANKLLRQLLGEKPDEPQALYALAILQRNLGHFDEARTELNRLANSPRFSATALCELGWLEVMVGSYSAVEAPLKRSLAIQPYWGNLDLKITLSLIWEGDLASAKAALDELPASLMQSDFGAGTAFSVFIFQRKPDDWLRFSKGVRRDWLQSNNDVAGPIALFNGWAQQMAGRDDAARVEWQAALKATEHRMADQPTDPYLLHAKGLVLTCLGEFAEAERAMRLAAEFSGTPPDLLELRIAEGQLDAAMDILESRRHITAAYLRLDPLYDPLRNTLRFKALLARAEADPKRSPHASEGNTAATSRN
jgi:tetratricopeptide (TPR) repeat protein